MKGQPETSREDKLSTWKKHSILAFTALILVILGLSPLYDLFFYSLSKLVFDESFGYLSVSLFVVVYLLLMSIEQGGFVPRLSYTRIIAGLFLASISLILYFTGYVYNHYIVQLQGLSFVFLFTALFISAFAPIDAKHVLPLLSLMLLIPPPAGWFDSITPFLSRLIGSMVASATGSEFVSKTGVSILIVETSQGVARFEIERACTGIITMSSVLAIAPVVLYTLSFSPRSTARRLAAAALSIMIGLLFGFLGNFIRVLLIVVGAKWLGPERGLELFHYSPSVIYAVLSVVVSFYIADRIGGLREALPSLVVDVPFLTPRYIVGIMMVLIVAGASFMSAVVAAESVYLGENVYQSGVIVDDIRDFIDNPREYLFYDNSDITITYMVNDEWLANILNALVVYRSNIVYNNKSYIGYIEMVDTPARLHTWQYCLMVQGYQVVDSFAKEINGSIIYFIITKRNNVEYILGFRLLPVLREDSNEAVLYMRLSVLTTYSNDSLKEISYILNSAGSFTISQSNNLKSLIFYTSIITYLLLMAVISTVVLETRLK